jgi:hypothetical protein
MINTVNPGWIILEFIQVMHKNKNILEGEGEVRQAAMTGFDLAQGSFQMAYYSELRVNPK